jgi:hypothetical protein
VETARGGERTRSKRIRPWVWEAEIFFVRWISSNGRVSGGGERAFLRGRERESTFSLGLGSIPHIIQSRDYIHCCSGYATMSCCNAFAQLVFSD